MTRRTVQVAICPVDSAARWQWSRVLDVRPVEECPLCGWLLVPGTPEYRTCRCEIGALLLREVS